MKALFDSLDPVLESLNETLTSIESILARIDEQNRKMIEGYQSRWGGVVITLPEAVQSVQKERKEWLRDNTSSSWEVSGRWFWFARESDATAFLLRWS